MSFQSTAPEVLQHAAEGFLVEMFEDGSRVVAREEENLDVERHHLPPLPEAGSKLGATYSFQDTGRYGPHCVPA